MTGAEIQKSRKKEKRGQIKKGRKEASFHSSSSSYSPTKGTPSPPLSLQTTASYVATPISRFNSRLNPPLPSPSALSIPTTSQGIIRTVVYIQAAACKWTRFTNHREAYYSCTVRHMRSCACFFHLHGKRLVVNPAPIARWT